MCGINERAIGLHGVAKRHHAFQLREVGENIARPGRRAPVWYPAGDFKCSSGSGGECGGQRGWIFGEACDQFKCCLRFWSVDSVSACACVAGNLLVALEFLYSSLRERTEVAAVVAGCEIPAGDEFILKRCYIISRKSHVQRAHLCKSVCRYDKERK